MKESYLRRFYLEKPWTSEKLHLAQDLELPELSATNGRASGKCKNLQELHKTLRRFISCMVDYQ